MAGLSNFEIIAEVGIRANTVNVAIHRVRKKIGIAIDLDARLFEQKGENDE